MGSLCWKGYEVLDEHRIEHCVPIWMAFGSGFPPRMTLAESGEVQMVTLVMLNGKFMDLSQEKSWLYLSQKGVSGTH